LNRFFDNFLFRFLQKKITEPEGGHYEEYDGVKHWIPAGYFWVWKWDNRYG